jgi:ElaB/YqjD/DUF883 family membrane-anchored ribosome-binding protein
VIILVKMKSKKLFSLVILLILLISPISTIIYGDSTETENNDDTDPDLDEQVSEEETEETEEETEELLSENEDDEEDYNPKVLAALYENQEQILVEIKGLLENQFGPFGNLDEIEDQIPQEILNSIRHGDKAHEEVDNEKWSNPIAAANQITRGMKHYSNALKQFYKHYLNEELEATETQDIENPEEPEEEEIKEHKTKLMTQYQENLADRIQEMSETMNQIMNQLGEEDQQKMFNVIGKLLSKLERIQERLSDSVVEEAIDLAEEAEEELDEAFTGMENQQLAQMLRTMYKLEAQIQKMEKIKSKLMENGLNVENEEQIITQLREALEQAKQDIENGDVGGAEGILGQASENAKGKGNKKDQ